MPAFACMCMCMCTSHIPVSVCTHDPGKPLVLCGLAGAAPKAPMAATEGQRGRAAVYSEEGTKAL